MQHPQPVQYVQAQQPAAQPVQYVQTVQQPPQQYVTAQQPQQGQQAQQVQFVQGQQIQYVQVATQPQPAPQPRVVASRPTTRRPMELNCTKCQTVYS